MEVHVGAKRDQQIRERLARDVVTLDGVGERDEHRMARGAGVAEVELALPFVELGEVVIFVGEVVGDSRVGVDRMHVPAHLARHQPRRDSEIFVVRARQPRAEFVGAIEIEISV